MIRRDPTGSHQENVWDYPRPPALEKITDPITIDFGRMRIAETSQAWRVLETSHPPVYYLPRDAFVAGVLVPAEGGSFCEWKGRAIYFDIVANGRSAPKAGWAYPTPTERFAAIAHHVALYAGPMDRCTVRGEVVTPQPGGFYGGWVTSWVTGPFKGGPGSWGW